MPQFSQLRCCFNRALRSKFSRTQSNDVEHGVDQHKPLNGFKKRDCLLDKNAILYDAFLQDSPLFEPRFRDRRTGASNYRMRYVSEWPTNAREYERLSNKFGVRSQKRCRARILFDRILLPADLWSLAAIWAGGVQFAGLVYIERERRERQGVTGEADKKDESTHTPSCPSTSASSELHPLISRLCVWPICSTVSCMRDGNSTVNWIRSAHSSANSVVSERSAQPTSWTVDRYCRQTEVEAASEPAAIRRIATSPELRTTPFTFRFDKAARSYLREIETKFRRNRDVISRQTSSSQQTLVDIRARSLDDLSCSDEQSDNELQPKVYDVLPQSARISTPPSSPSVQSANERFEIKPINRSVGLETPIEQLDSYSEYDSDETQSSCDESDSLSTASSESESETRSALFRTAEDFKPLDALDIQLGRVFNSLNRDAARREHARALDAARGYLEAASQPITSRSTSQLLKQVSADCDVSLDNVRQTFTRAVQHAERAGDESLRSRILFNHAVFHELMYRSGSGLLSDSLHGVPDTLRAAKRCYVEALEADPRNVQAAANLASLCWMICTQLADRKVTQRAYDRRARKYAKFAADLGDQNSANFLAAIETHVRENESESESESEQYTPAVPSRPFEFDSNRFAFGL